LSSPRAPSPPTPIGLVRIIARLNVGGPAIQAITLTDQLTPRGYRTTLVRGSESAHEGSMDYLAQRFGVRPVLIPSLRRDPGWHDLRALGALIRLLRRARPQIVHTHAAKAGTLGRVASIIASCGRPRPIRIHTFHGHSLTGYFSARTSARYRAIERVLAARTDRLVAVSAEVRDELVALDVAPADRFEVVPLGFDLSRFDSAPEDRELARTRVRAELGIATDTQVVTLIARLVPIKRVDRFLRAAVALLDLGVHFVIVGDGELRDGLAASPEARALGAKLTWTGLRRDIPEICFASDVVALTSDNEGTPVSLIEAAAAGVPAVSTAVGGAASVIRNGETGLLVAPEDEAALTNALRSLVLDPTLRGTFGATARAHALENFTLERLVDDLDQLYRRLLDDRSK
jgi:glycosyltransferase involved in cell wall biosynthesis